MMMEAHRTSQTSTTFDLNVVIAVLTTLLSGEGAKLAINFVMHVVCMLVFGGSLDLSLSKETKFDRDPNTCPSEIVTSKVLFYWLADMFLIIICCWTLQIGFAKLLKLQ